MISQIPQRYKNVGKTKKHSDQKGIVHVDDLDRMTFCFLKKSAKSRVSQKGRPKDTAKAAIFRNLIKQHFIVQILWSCYISIYGE